MPDKEYIVMMDVNFRCTFGTEEKNKSRAGKKCSSILRDMVKDFIKNIDDFEIDVVTVEED